MGAHKIVGLEMQLKVSLFINNEVDPGNDRAPGQTLAICLTHASRTASCTLIERMPLR